MKFFVQSALLILLTVFFSSARLCWCWVSSAPGDPSTSLYEFQEFAGIRGGLIVLGWQDNDIRGGLDVEMHAPAFHPWPVRAGWFDFGIVGLPVWQAVLALVILYQLFRFFLFRWQSRHTA